MAKTPVSEAELQLKKKARRRLLGAILLVLLVVVFVPMFLDREPRPQKQDIDIRIPPIPGQTQAPQAPAPTAPAPAAAMPPVPAPEKPAAVPSTPANDVSANAPSVVANDGGQPSAPAQASTPPAPAEPVTKPAEVTKKADAEPAERYVIQVGAFSDPANARHLVEKLKAEKVPAYTEPVKTSQGEKTRVRAGPYATLAAAEQGRSRLKTLKLLPAGEAKIVHKGE